MDDIKGKKILIGVSGGISAYKICELVRIFRKKGAEVRVIMTPSAVNFVSPVTLSVLSGNDVIINLFPEYNPCNSASVNSATWHVYNGLWADVFIIAPATANTIAKITYGICDNFLTSAVLSSRCPVIICPAMDEDMYLNEATVHNLSVLQERGYVVIDPERGELASGLYGVGRLPEPENIFRFTVEYLKDNKNDFAGKRFLITAGPTYEPIDSVRYIGNYSSGKMGFAIAKAAVSRGADVTIISGPVSLATPANTRRINVQTASEMLEAVKDNMNQKDFIIMSAAISDFRPRYFHEGKIKKSGKSPPVIETVENTDILQYLGERKNGYRLIGFALETENEVNNARDKLIKKNLDMIIVNNPHTEGAGFGTDTNVITIIDKHLNEISLPKLSKFDAANQILNYLHNIE
jgi:phosphopantothenoylcysteine decarboxylase/phosphopantothenate--cysteine ligase